MSEKAYRRFFLLDWAIYLQELEKRVNGKVNVEANELEQSKPIIGDTKFQSLLAQTTHRDWSVREQAARQLAEIQHPDACHALIMLLKDEHYSVRWIAMHSMIDNRRCSVRPLLEELTRDYQSSCLLESAHYILNELHNRGELTPEESRVLQSLNHSKKGIALAQIANEVLISEQSTG